MSLPIISADQRLAEKRGVKGVLVGKSGIGKTSQLWTLPLPPCGRKRYLIKPDVVIIRDPEPDEVINASRLLVDSGLARLLRKPADFVTRPNGPVNAPFHSLLVLLLSPRHASKS
jgi:hypothetical protein